LSAAFNKNPAIYAYDIANEPHDSADDFVRTMYQAGVTAIRNAGDNTQVWVEGNNYADPQWTAAQPPWIRDPANNTTYSIHDYPVCSGTPCDISGFAQAISDMKTIVAWCKQYSVRCSLGETGWFGSNTTANWQQWNAYGDQLYQLLDDAGMDATYWAAAGSYDADLWAYSANPAGVVQTVPGVPNTLVQAQTQSQVLEAHLSK
jgi:endoglucanase